MKRLILILFLIPSLAFGAFTEFYMTSGGSNINAGSTTSNTAAYTSTNGNWSTSTHIFTPTDGSTPASSVNVGDFASIYVDGATTAVYIVRITAIAAGANGAITTSTTVIYGTAPTTSATTRSIKVGGAWKGPSGAATFPFGLSGTISALIDTSSDVTRLNVKNDQTYSMTAALSLDTLSTSRAIVMQGYSSSVGDGGKAILTSNVTSGDNFTCGASGTLVFIDLIFASTAGSGTVNLFTLTSSGNYTFIRCVAHGARASGFTFGSTRGLFFESEAYDCNKAGNAGSAGFLNFATGVMMCVNCYSHDHASGSNADAFGSSVSAANSTILLNCIADTSAGNGLTTAGSGAIGTLFVLNSNFYNNTGDAIKLVNSTAGGFPIIVNSNFLKNGGKGINNTVTGQAGIIYNNGRGSGTQANGSSDTLGGIVDTSTDITYASGVTTWVAPTTGNFSTVPGSAAVGAGRELYTETDGTNTGTVGFPDIGAAQAATPTPTPTSTPTPTPTSTPCSGSEVSYGFQG